MHAHSDPPHTHLCSRFQLINSPPRSACRLAHSFAAGRGLQDVEKLLTPQPSSILAPLLSVKKSHTCAASATVDTGDFVEVHYEGRTDEGEVFDNSRERDEPLSFIVGSGRVVKGFDDAVMGLSVGGKRVHRVEPKDGYGEWTEDMTAKIPKDKAPEGLNLGSVVQLTNGMQAVVIAMDDETITLDANMPLAGKAMNFDVELMHLVKKEDFQRATFGAGCFWSVELAFQRVFGVLLTQAGYSQGNDPNVTYEQVCSGTTGHNEVVQVTYDPAQVSYRELLQAFYDKHDPTTLNRQGSDSGPQYRSGIYYHTLEQKEEALAFTEELNKAKYNGTIVTEIQELKNYTAAEEYHQSYLEKGGRFGRAQSAKKGCTDPIRCYG